MNERDFDRIQKTIDNATYGLGKLLDGVGMAVNDVADAVNSFSDAVSGRGPGAPAGNGPGNRTAGAPRNGNPGSGSPYDSASPAGRFQDRVVSQNGKGTVYHGTVEQSQYPAVKQKLYLAPGQANAKGAVKTVFGYGMVGLGAAALGTAILLTGGLGIIGGGLLIAAGLPVGISGSVEMSRAKRFKQYVKELGNKTLLNLTTLADRTGKSMDFLRKDLKKMSDQKLFTQAHFDDEEEIFMISDETYQDYRNLLESKKQEEAAALEKDQELYKAGLSSAGVEIVKQGQEYLEKIGRINAELPDPLITEKLSRLEQVIRTILAEVRKKPSSATELRRLMNYYLPTTWKLLTTYKEIEEEPVKTEQMEATQKEIEDTLDTINSAFEKLLNQLFQTKAWDVSADISVLNTMLNTEGLTDEGIQSFVKENEK